MEFFQKGLRFAQNELQTHKYEQQDNLYSKTLIQWTWSVCQSAFLIRITSLRINYLYPRKGWYSSIMIDLFCSSLYWILIKSPSAAFHRIIQCIVQSMKMVWFQSREICLHVLDYQLFFEWRILLKNTLRVLSSKWVEVSNQSWNYKDWCAPSLLALIVGLYTR